MMHKAENYMNDYLKVFGVTHLPPIVETTGQGIVFQLQDGAPLITIGLEDGVENIPQVEWLIVTGQVLLHQIGSDIVPLEFGPESEANETHKRVADDIAYIAELAAIYQCYLQNPVEVFCLYDDAVELGDDSSLHPIAVVLGLTHPRGLEVMGFDDKQHAEVIEESEFFKGLITQKRPDLSLLVALQNAWQKQRDVAVKISKDKGLLRLARQE